MRFTPLVDYPDERVSTAKCNDEHSSQDCDPMSFATGRDFEPIRVLTLKNKGTPIKRGAPPLLSPHLFFCFSQRCGWRQTLVEHSEVKVAHQFSGSFIIDFPKTRYDTFRACIQECTRQSNDAFPTSIFSQPGTTRTQDNQIR